LDRTVSIDAAISYIDAYAITACFYHCPYLIVELPIAVGITCYREDQTTQSSNIGRSHRSSGFIIVLAAGHARINRYSWSSHIYPATMVRP